MRIVGGSLKGRRFNPPRGLPVRPTTDSSKESIFNILNNQLAWEEIKALDLFAGTGNISYELASRGCNEIIAVDNSPACVKYIQKTASELGIENISIELSDVFSFLRNCSEQFDLIFADPPYTVKNLEELVNLVFENNLLKEEGWMILEHEPKISFKTHPHYRQERNYGSSVFSFFL